MSRAISSGLQEELYKSQANIVILTLVKIDHTDLASPILLVNNNTDIISNGDTYSKAQFIFTAPAEVEGTISNANIILDGVDRTNILAIRSISSPATLTISVIEASTPNTIEVGPWEFELKNVNFTGLRVTGELVYQTYTRDNISILKYTNDLFPGLYAFTKVS